MFKWFQRPPEEDEEYTSVFPSEENKPKRQSQQQPKQKQKKSTSQKTAEQQEERLAPPRRNNVPAPQRTKKERSDYHPGAPEAQKEKNPVEKALELLPTPMAVGTVAMFLAPHTNNFGEKMFEPVDYGALRRAGYTYEEILRTCQYRVRFVDASGKPINGVEVDNETYGRAVQLLLCQAYARENLIRRAIAQLYGTAFQPALEYRIEWQEAQGRYVFVAANQSECQQPAAQPAPQQSQPQPQVQSSAPQESPAPAPVVASSDSGAAPAVPADPGTQPASSVAQSQVAPSMQIEPTPEPVPTNFASTDQEAEDKTSAQIHALHQRLDRLSQAVESVGKTQGNTARVLDRLGSTMGSQQEMLMSQQGILASLTQNMQQLSQMQTAMQSQMPLLAQSPAGAHSAPPLAPEEVATLFATASGAGSAPEATDGPESPASQDTDDSTESLPEMVTSPQSHYRSRSRGRR